MTIETTPVVTTTAPGVLRRRAVSLVSRMLDGAGALSVLAYREQPQTGLDALAHGRSAAGDLVLVTRPPAHTWWARMLAGDVLPVRLDVTLQAPSADICAVSASTHGLGTLSFWSPRQIDNALDDGALDDRVAAAATLPGARVATIECPTYLLHDTCGVTSIGRADLLTPGSAYPAARDELEAADLIHALGPAGFADLFAQVLTSERVGTVWAPAAVPFSTGGAIDLLDVDGHGFTMANLSTRTPCTVFVPFAEPARDVFSLAEAVRRLAD